ncbi:MAG: ABC transporter permease subunit, partial [Candidatus Dormibacteraceae bacterium]
AVLVLASLTLLAAGGIVAIRHVQLPPSLVAAWEGLLFLPVLAGMFLGAPLVAREVERGTLRLAWTQSVTRTRWFWTATGGILAVLIAGAALAQLVISPLLMPLLADEGGGLMFPAAFDEVGVVPVAYAVFAFALGVFCSAGLRRTVAAMFLCLLLFAAVRIPIDTVVREHYLPPVTKVLAGVGTQYPGFSPQYGLLLDFSYLNAAGDRTGYQPICLKGTGPTCAIRYEVSYQPPSRFWPIQLVESGIYLILSALLLAGAARFVRRLGT